MTRNFKGKTSAALVILATTLMIAMLSQTINIANAQTDAIVIIPSAIGGTTNPSPGNYTYPNGTAFTLTATPDAGYSFLYWIISGDYTPGHTGTQPTFYIDPDTGLLQQFPEPTTQSSLNSLVLYNNPQTITCGFGYTYQYQAVFAPIGGPSPAPNPTEAGVVILPSTGGTTDPAPGTYVYANGTTYTLTATPAAGYVFHYWVVAGNYTPGHTAAAPTFYTDPETGQIVFIPRTTALTGLDSLVFANNPVTLTCGYGYTYQWQAVFDLAVTTSPSPSTSPTTSSTPQATTTPIATSSASPSATQSASPIATSTPTGGTGGGISLAVIAAIVVVIIIIIIAVVAVMMRRKK